MLAKCVIQVIALTEELLATAKQNDISGSNAGPNVTASQALSKSKGKEVVRPCFSNSPLCLVFSYHCV